MATARTYGVVVHKASIPLLKGESLRAFMNEVRKAVTVHVVQKFNLDEKKGGVFPVEIFSDKAVFTVVPDFSKSSSNDFHVAMKFTRTDKGTFNITDTIKVRPVTSFVPATSQVAKAKAMGMDAWVAGGLFRGVL